MERRSEKKSKKTAVRRLIKGQTRNNVDKQQ
jgi:hypothetical protein